MSKLASEEFEGRETGTPGQKKAAEYIAAHFENIGLQMPIGKETYFQEIAFSANGWTSILLQSEEQKWRNLWDYYSYPAYNSNRDTTMLNEIIFLGYGIDDESYSDYKGIEIDLAGKTALIYSGEPVNRDSISYLTNADSLSDWATNWKKKLQVAKKYGVDQVLIIDTDFKANLRQARKTILNTRLQIGKGENPAQYANHFFITSDVAKRLIDSTDFQTFIEVRDSILNTGKSQSLVIPTTLSFYQKKRTRELLSENVVGFLEGTDSLLRSEMVVVTGHYDHLGIRGESIYFGANDNASGTSAVMEIAQACAEAKQKGIGPRRSILFMLFSGEEKGLLGSKYYVTKPLYDLGTAVANVNIDMVGRADKIYRDSVDIEHIYVIGADRLSSELHDINEAMNEKYTKLKLDYTYNAESDPNRYYYRSDHYNFALHNIPIIFYFNGTHEDYHRTSDTVDKIEFDRLENVTKLAFHTVWQLANQDKRIEVDKIQEEEK